LFLAALPSKSSDCRKWEFQELINGTVWLPSFAVSVSAAGVSPTSQLGSRTSSISVEIVGLCLRFGIAVEGRRSLHMRRCNKELRLMTERQWLIPERKDVFDEMKFEVVGRWMDCEGVYNTRYFLLSDVQGL
jgi:hypothetical protein